MYVSKQCSSYVSLILGLSVSASTFLHFYAFSPLLLRFITLLNCDTKFNTQISTNNTRHGLHYLSSLCGHSFTCLWKSINLYEPQRQNLKKKHNLECRLNFRRVALSDLYITVTDSIGCMVCLFFVFLFMVMIEIKYQNNAYHSSYLCKCTCIHACAHFLTD